jgi:hypothetical protein
MTGDGSMPLKKIALLTIVFLIPSFVYFVMCPFAHSFTASKNQQLVVFQQQFQKNNLPQKEFASPLLGHASLHPFTLQAYDKTLVYSLQPSFDLELSNRLTLLITTRLNI